jgi:hypothetical protein
VSISEISALSADALDRGAAGAELILQPLKTAWRNTSRRSSAAASSVSGALTLGFAPERRRNAGDHGLGGAPELRDKGGHLLPSYALDMHT